MPGSDPFYLPQSAGATGCLLLHGFTAMPEEMRLLGEFLARGGYNVLGLRLAGHATCPDDLKRTRWTDWLLNVEDGLARLGAFIYLSPNLPPRWRCRSEKALATSPYLRAQRGCAPTKTGPDKSG